MVDSGRGRLFRRKDGKYLIYLPKDLAQDSMFPFKDWQKGKTTGKRDSIPVKVSFKIGGVMPLLLIEEWKESPIRYLNNGKKC